VIEEHNAAPRHVVKLLVVLAIIAVLVGLDQWSKKVAMDVLMGNPPILYGGGLFRWTYATNSGAFLSLGSTLSEANRFWVLVGFNGVILTALALFLLFGRQLRMAPAVALALILAGGIGNLIDRLFRGGEVIDFMHIDLGFSLGWIPMKTGVFNVADMAIVGGLLLLIGLEMFQKKGVGQPEPAVDAPPPAPPAGFPPSRE
jgi:signal peptidase II